MKVGIIGSQQSILGFKSIGLTPFPVSSAEEVKASLEDITKNNEYGVIFITEDWAKKSQSSIDEYINRPLPAIITIPSQQGATGEGMRNLRKITERAIGSDILFKNDS
ncbi:MAG: V-type ATP synthase subunit F [Candidatus Jacksonbacteria bacterium]|nr:V-type ATP synthase subunit F [Candidatus Jacksonbacteria bacterium]MBT6034342.1 V-type ATP synthase subunit F [Candidatus Jacksonbacteria bacterium]MBT6301180.1 V-type ATP synthase subunit F [Candidatus Jacksonbacteria bacterium]MBT6955258.1 V-type ATP synthase subunit F [Candidatus Jacksonbacteria bacterium]MBT7008344.1 V-type ATP synthase subunit F [Candidatus Jacksonbacteria bacterium]